MPSEIFWVFQKERKRVFQLCINIVYVSFFWNITFVLVLAAAHCCCGDNMKYGLLSKHLFQRKRQYAGWKNLTVTTNF